MRHRLTSLLPSRSPSRAKFPPRQRKGITVVMFAVFLMFMMMFVAVAADLSRAHVGLNQLQTAADASAMAGAVELLTNKSPAAGDTAKEYAAKHRLFGITISQTTVVVESGDWDDVARTFTPTNWGDPETDAVRTAVTRFIDFQFAPLFGFTGITRTARAIGWAGGSVQGSNDCLKPWSIPLSYLKKSIWGPSYDRSADTAYHRLTEEELAKLDSMVANNDPALNFTLKQGTGSPDDNAGNFYSISMPALCTSSDKRCDGNPETGNAVVSENIRTCNNSHLSIGDILLTQPGEAAQPTIDAIQDFCESQGADRSCANVPVKASFFTLPTEGTMQWVTQTGVNIDGDKGQGRFPVEIRVMGSFDITGVQVEQTPGKGGGTKATITGRFTREDDPGPISHNPSLLRRTLLVK